MKLVWGGGGLVWEAQAPEGTKVIIPRQSAIEGLTWRAMVKGGRWENVEEITGGG